MKIVIPGEPIPKLRPRFFVSRGKKLAYNSQASKESEIAYRIKQQALKAEFDRTLAAYQIDLRFYFRPPPGKEANLKLWGYVPHVIKPDLDNLEKWILDCANGILYRDDAQITKLSSSKHFCINPRTEIEIMPHKCDELTEDMKKIVKCFTREELSDFYNDSLKIGKNVSPNREGDIRMLIEFAKKYSKKLADIAK